MVKKNMNLNAIASLCAARSIAEIVKWTNTFNAATASNVSATGVIMELQKQGMKVETTMQKGQTRAKLFLNENTGQLEMHLNATCIVPDGVEADEHLATIDALLNEKPQIRHISKSTSGTIRRRWTIAEDNEIKANKLSSKALARKFNRTIDAIYARRNVLKQQKA